MDEYLQLLQMQMPEQKLYENYNPAMQLKQGLLTPSTQMQPQTNQNTQQITQAADAANQQMLQNAMAGQQVSNNGQLQSQQAQAAQMLQQQQQVDAQRRAAIIKLGMMFLGGNGGKKDSDK